MTDPPATAPAARILVIEDERSIRRFLAVTLDSHGYEVVEADSGEEGLRQMVQRQPELVLLDLGLPDMDGLVLIGRLREWSRVPVVVLSARGREQDKVAALDLGADDYLTKPFGVGELLARIRVSLRHATVAASGAEASTFTVGDLKVDLARRQVVVRGAEIHLTPLEYRLLAALVANAGKVVTHRQLFRATWGPEYDSEVHYVRLYMGQLRHKIEDDPARPRYLRTEPGVGYRLAVE